MDNPTKIDPQTLERLMLDQALGVLTPDVAALLAAYSTHAGEQHELAAWTNLVGVAKEAMTETAPVDHANLPALPSTSFSGRPLGFWTLALRGLAAAALLAVGIGIGIRLPLTAPPLPDRSAPIAEVPEIIAQPQSTPSEKNDFWSSQRLLAVALEDKRSSSLPRQFNWLSGQFEQH